MEKEKLYDQIEQYLEGTLQGAEANAFEKSLESDKDLAAEVELHRRLQTELGDPNKIDLRQKLQKISDNFTEEKQEAKVRSLSSRYNVLLVAAGLALAIGLLYWLMDNGDPTIPSNEQILTEDQTDPQEDPTENIEATPQEEIAQDNSNPDPATNDTPKEEIPQDAPQPNNQQEQLANNFDPNPELEAILEQSQSNDFDFAFEVNQNRTSDGKLQIKLRGETEAHGLDGSGLNLAFFDNDPASFNDNKSVFDASLGVKESSEEPIEAFGKEYKYYDLKYDESLNLKPGIYYYVVTKEGSDEPLYVGKLVVEK